MAAAIKSMDLTLPANLAKGIVQKVQSGSLVTA